MEIKGKIIAVLPETSGVSKATGNAWKKREYVLETHDTYPRKVHFTLFGDRADQFPLSMGEEVTVSFDLESREYNNRWYTDVRAWKVDKDVAPAAQPAPQPMPGDFPAPVDFQSSDPNSDLPF